MAIKYLKCEICGNIITFIDEVGPIPECCGQEMTELVPNTTDAAQEKHVPAIERDGANLTVKVGSVAHPMTPEHHIAWITVVQGNYTLTAQLDPTGAPEAAFTLPEAGSPIEVYEYCNLHGLWSAKG
jgi:superoxide reductase